MTVYDACMALEIWHIVKARVEVWALSKYVNEEAIIELQVIAKNRFKELAMKHHPDKGGDIDEYINFQEACDLLKEVTLGQLLTTLDDEKKANLKIFKPGSDECYGCRKWSNIVKTCVTTTCSGLEEISHGRIDFKTTKNIQGESNANS